VKGDYDPTLQIKEPIQECLRKLPKVTLKKKENPNPAVSDSKGRPFSKLPRIS
jgi:hypothetical protein